MNQLEIFEPNETKFQPALTQSELKKQVKQLLKTDEEQLVSSLLNDRHCETETVKLKRSFERLMVLVSALIVLMSIGALGCAFKQLSFFFGPIGVGALMTLWMSTHAIQSVLKKYARFLLLHHRDTL